MLSSCKTLKLSLFLLAAIALPRYASALIVGPYTPDASTTFLFHFDEAAGGSVTTNNGTVGGNAYTVSIGTSTGTSIAATNVTTLLGGTAYSTVFTNCITFPATNAGYMIGFAGASSSFTTDTGNGGTRSPNAITESVLGIGASSSASWTIEAMIKPALTNFNQEIVCMDSYASSRGFQFKINNAGQLQFQTIGGTAYSQVVGIPASGANAFVANTWYHVAVVYNSTNNSMQLYWTAVSSGVTSAAPLGAAGTPTSGSMGTTQGAVTGPLVIGNKDRLAALETFNGSIDEVRISNVARSSSQMLFNSANVTISQQPVGEEGVDYGSTGLLTVSASSLVSVGYQWRQNNSPLSGATNATYTFTNATMANAGNYVCVITNANGNSVTSSIASVIIGAANFLTNRYSFIADASDSIGGMNGTNVGGVTYNAGGTVTLDGSSGYIQLPSNIINTNSGAVTIETWCTFGTIANNTMLFAFGNTNGANGYNYIFATPHGGTARMAITAGTYTGEQGAVTGAPLDNSNNVQVVCVFAPDLNTETFYVNGVQAAVNTNVTVTLASVVDNFSYIGHSLFSADPYLAGTINEFRIYAGAMSAASVAQSYVQGYSNKLSDGAVAILYSPTNIATAQGLPVTFSTVATGHQPILYQWLKNGLPISGATNASYSYAPTFADNDDSFEVLATNTIGATTYSAASSPATLSVSVPATLTWFNNSQDNAWNLTSGNWNAGGSDYAQFDGVVLNDSDYNNSTPGPTIDLQFAATPISMTVSNTLDTYEITSLSADGSLSVQGPVLKTGPGTLILDVTNSSTTPVTVKNGIVQVGNNDTVGSLGSGPVTNNGTIQFNRTDSIGVPNDIHGSGSLVVNSGSITPTSANSDYSGNTVLNNSSILYAANTNALGSTAGGTIVGDGSQLYITANVNFGPEALSLTGTGNGNGALRKGGGGATVYGGAVTLAGNAAIGMDSGATLTLTSAINDGGNGYGLTAVGAGTLVLDATNNFSGGFMLNGPIVDANTNGALGTGTISINGAGRIVLATGMNLTNFVQASTVSPGVATGLLMVNDNTNGIVTTISGPLEFDATPANGGNFIGPSSSGYLNVTGPVTNNNTGTVSSRNGLVRFSGGGSYTAFTLNQGTASLGAINGLCVNATISMAGSGAATLDLNGFSQALAGITDGATNPELVTNSVATPATLTINTVSSDIYSGVIGGNVTLVITGSGSQELAGTNTYTGNTIINGGVLQLDTPSLVASTTVNIGSGGTLLLNYSTTNTISGLVLNGVSQPAGTYNSSSSSPYIIGGGNLLVAPVNITPTNIVATVTGTNLILSWPADHTGWRLLVQTNALSRGLGTNWVTIPNSASVNAVTNAINPANGTVFYRMVYP